MPANGSDTVVTLKSVALLMLNTDIPLISDSVILKGQDDPLCCAANVAAGLTTVVGVPPVTPSGCTRMNGTASEPIQADTNCVYTKAPRRRV